VSGLPDEAGDARGQVKAWIAANLADQLVAAGVAVFDHASDGHCSSVLYGRGPFPAGVYVSDGQGNVEMFEFAREECGWESHEWDLCQQMTGVVLAALSATDTEGTDGR
jgi:hypothetical protein